MRFTFVLMAIVGCMAAGRSAAAVARHPSSDGGHGRVNASEIPIVVGNSDRIVNLQELSGMRIAEVERLTGKNMVGSASGRPLSRCGNYATSASMSLAFRSPI